MRINSKDTLAGQPILKIREMLRRRPWRLYVEFAVDFLNTDKDTAQKILEELEKQGYLMPEQNEEGWMNTSKGYALMQAKASKPILRTTAEKKLREILVRIEQVNQDPYYLYKIKKAAIFGSYLTDAEFLGDLDIAIELVSVEDDLQKRIQLETARINQTDRVFHNTVERAFWPQEEVYRLLKGRSRTISLHSLNDPFFKETEVHCETVFER
jgi:predicted nucleotidyltransferase